MMDRILGYMSRTPSIGMVFPDDPNVVGWDANKSFAASLAGRLGITELPEHFVFPVGNMFWARVDALKRFWLLDLDWNDYPDEPLPNDGSLLHALERLFPLGLKEGANQCALTNVSGMSR
jgi:lipopolysaccharide biosynthesis protein